jgi:hypothetical protein
MSKLKLHAICTPAAYTRANEWYRGRKPNVPLIAMGNVQDIYSNTGHRNYLSTFLERFIIKFVNYHKPITGYEAAKIVNAGLMVHSRFVGGDKSGQIASTEFVKNHNIKVGKPDIQITHPTKPVFYIEVKVKDDRLSQAQKDFMAEGWTVYIIRTIDEFFEVWDSLQ